MRRSFRTRGLEAWQTQSVALGPKIKATKIRDRSVIVWILIYRIDEDYLSLERTGSHSDLFR